MTTLIKQLKAQQRLLIASSNQGKVREFNRLLEPLHIQCLALTDLEKVDEPEETGDSFRANAELKARYYGQRFQLLTLADDSGLSVTALQGRPGIYSARFAKEQGSFGEAVTALFRELPGLESTPAYFSCCLVLYNPATEEILNYTAEAHGQLILQGRGETGFGYDPFFVPEGYQQTYAELGEDLKNRISHRTLALEKFKQDLMQA